MNKVVTVNLNGRAYQIEEHGYTLLTKYLGQAEAQLVDNPDREEIIADFEQAIAEKCDELLGENKSVVGNSEIAAIIDQMGPVDGKESESTSDQPNTKPVKRLYLIKDGAIIGGVCNGLATYFNIDVTIVRLIVIVATFLSSGALVLAYLVLLFIVPEAKTPEQKAAAQGTNFDSKTLIETAKKKYASINNEEHWKQVAQDSKPMLNGIGSVIRATLRVVAGVCAFVSGVILLSITVLATSSVWSLLVNGNLFDHIVLDPSLSKSLLIVLIVCAYVVIAVPLYIISMVFYRYAKRSTFKQNIWIMGVAIALFAVALNVGIAAFSATPALHNGNVHYRSIENPSVDVICIGNCNDAAFRSTLPIENRVQP